MEIQKSRIRGPHLEVLVRGPTFLESIARHDRVPFHERFLRADEMRRVIASNKRLIEAFSGDDWRTVVHGVPCHTGTLAAYTSPGQKLGQSIEYADPETGYRYLFRVPEAYQKEKDAILVAEPPDYALEIDGETVIVHAAKVDIVTDFPFKFSLAYYKAEPVHGIPSGKAISMEDPDSSYLGRTDSFVGPVSLAFLLDLSSNSRRRALAIDLTMSNGLGIIAESPVIAIMEPERRGFLLE
ncbi:hypothetical protein H0O00_04220 [Candidatus Micrarchaeota archaeon]|nr:hypothetical protein [Candidatus Micrarchaeota archaeon]